ncbi:MAG: hypothetical protein ACYS9X_14400 [Planctomycetota bacterium]
MRAPGLRKLITRRRLAVVAAIHAVVLGCLFANWLLAPLTVSPETLDRNLMDAILALHATQEGPHADKPIYLGRLAGNELQDFPDEDMAFWRARGHAVRPVSAVEPDGLGGLRDKTTKASAFAVMLKGHSWVGRNAVEVNLVTRSGFCANGVTLRLAHNLWGWRVAGSRPFYDF